MAAEEKQISRLDRAFAAFLSHRTTLDDKEKQRFSDIVTELSSRQNHGHSCLHIDTQLQNLMQASGLVSTRDRTPLILEQDRLYLHRYWRYETRLAARIAEMTEKQLTVDNLEATLERYFPPMDDNIDWQRLAAKTAVSRYFSMITGGPGTGKTTTVVKILALLLELSQQPLHIALAAPTGKAAMRLQESIGSSKSDLPCSTAITQNIPETVTTLHRLLGVKPASPYFQHHAKNPLPHDVVVVDEASMIDLALMSKLIDALKPNARLILLGDKDQLASVESGAVLADLTTALPGNTLELKKSFRFDENIQQLADAINAQQAEQAWQLVNASVANIELLQADPIPYIADKQIAYLELISSGADFEEIYQTFNAFQVLCATRHGKNSVSDINLKIEQQLAAQNLIRGTGLWYSGRPIMVTQNDAGMHLYNGDIGLCLADKQQHGKLMVFFARPDGSVKKYLPSRLPHCETVFAMTIHKSQGSEFTEILIALPEVMNPVLTKELLYTAVTRAKKTVRLVVSQAVFNTSIQQRVERHSGLVEKLSLPRISEREPQS